MPSLSNFILYVILITHLYNPALPLSINDSLRTPVIATLPPSLSVTCRLRFLRPRSGCRALHHDRRGLPSSISYLGVLSRPGGSDNDCVLDRQGDPACLDHFWSLRTLPLPRPGLRSCISCIFARIFLPETRGKTLAELCSLYK